MGRAGAPAFPSLVAALLAAGVPWRGVFLLIVTGFLAHAWINRRLHVVPSPRITGRGRWAVSVAVVGGGLQMTFPLYLASLVVDDFAVRARSSTRSGSGRIA